MDVTYWKELASAIKDAMTGLGIVMTGAWALWRFVLQRESHAKLEFDVDLRFLGPQADQLLVEVVALVTNKGSVRHWLSDFRFDLLRLPRDEVPTEGDDRINHQVLFEPLVRKRYWIPPSWISSFIDPGVEQRFRYVTAVPRDSAYLLLYAEFKYPDAESEYHTAQKVFAVPESGTDG